MEQLNGKRDVGATVNRYMDPVTVCLNLWASQRIFKAGGGSGSVHWDDVFPKVEKPEPLPFPRNARGETIIHPDDLEAPTATKYADRPHGDDNTESACECVEWAIASFPCDGPFREVLRSLLFAVHPDGGRFMALEYPRDPFMAHSVRSMPSDRYSDCKDYSRILRNRYMDFRRLMHDAIGCATYQDLLAVQKKWQDYIEHRRQINAAEGRWLQENMQKPRNGATNPSFLGS